MIRILLLSALLLCGCGGSYGDTVYNSIAEVQEATNTDVNFAIIRETKYHNYNKDGGVAYFMEPSVIVDRETGCEYIKSLENSITIRYDSNGQPKCGK